MPDDLNEHQQWLQDYDVYTKEENKMIVSDSGGGDFQLAPAGNHIARSFALIDLGTQQNQMYNTWRRQIFIQWELPNEFMEIDGEKKPFIIGKFYTASLSDKAHLTHDLESWRGRAFTEDELKGFDLKNILNKPCMLNVIHGKKRNGGDKAEVSSVSPLPKGMNCPELVNTIKYFSFDNFDQAVFDSLSEGLQNMIKKSKEWQTKDNQPEPEMAGADDFDDDIPF